MNTRIILFLAAVCLLPVVIPTYGFIAALCFLVATATVLNRPSHRMCVTLSVPEILQDTMDAFKAALPPFETFSTDFSSATAVKGDKITAHISQLPAVQAYDATNGFNNSPANVTTLIQDVSVTLSSFNHVPIQIKWLDQLSAKKALYKEAIRNYGYVLAKKVLDDLLGQITLGNSLAGGITLGAFFNRQIVATPNVNLDQMEAVRTQMNTQKAAPMGRFGIVNSSFAASLQNDDRIKSALFYSQLNGGEGYRHFRNVAGFENIWEYPDFPANSVNATAFFGDRRALVIANRRVDFSTAAQELGVPQIMQFYPMTDEETGLQMTGVAWQAVGTGDVFVSAAVLYGVTAGANVTGESPTVVNHGADQAGLVITSS